MHTPITGDAAAAGSPGGYSGHSDQRHVLMLVTCAHCRSQYRIDEQRLDELKRRNPPCKRCGRPVFGPAAPCPDPGAPLPPDPWPAAIGPYRIEALLGKGGMGSVYKGWDESLRRHAAIKVLSPEYCGDEETRRRFLVEARALARLVHPNITQIYSAGQHGEQPYFAMEFVAGRSTRQLLDEQGKLDPRQAIRIVRSCCAGLAHAQQMGIIHRDIKPANILIAGDEAIKITDFGIAKIVKEDHRLTTTGMIIGTPSYISPEQARGEEVDFRADIYSLGVTLYELLMGEPPFAADNAMTLLMKHVSEPVRFPVHAREAAVPPPLTGIIRKMMAKQPHGRYLNYEHLSQDLAQAEARLRQAKPAGAPGEGMAARRRPAAKPAGAPLALKLAVAALLLGAGYFLVSERGTSPPPATSAPPATELPPPAAGAGPLAATDAGEPAAVTADRRLTGASVEESLVEILDEGSFRVFGTVRNMESEPLRALHVEVQVFNALDEILARRDVPTEPPVLLPGETARFSVLFGNVIGMERFQIETWVPVAANPDSE